MNKSLINKQNEKPKSELNLNNFSNILNPVLNSKIQKLNMNLV